MKANTPVKDLIRQAHTVHAVPELIAEFNWNRYATLTADNNPAQSVIARDPDIYPVESFVAANRPRKGHVKAQVDFITLLADYSPLPPATRHHIAEIEDIYKYWSAPDPAGASAPYAIPANASGTLPTGCNPFVSYDRICNTNKIVIGLENSVVGPTQYTIHVQTSVGGAWTQIADQTNTTVDSAGRIILYYGAGGWGMTKTLAYSTGIAGIQLRVTRMNTANSYFQLIEIAALLEKDISAYLESCGDQLDMGDTTTLTPIGKISANTASISLFNGLVDEDDYSKGLIFNHSNSDSPFYLLMNENVKFTLAYIYDASAYGGTSTERVQEFVMYAEQDWGADLQETVSIAVRDASKFLLEIKCPETFYTVNKSLSIGEVIWRMLDNVGFLDYNIDIGDVATPMDMSYFWVKPDKYVWETLNELAEATQTAIYFDSYGILQVKTKEAAFDATATPVWTLRGETSGIELEDIVQDSLRAERKDISSVVKVNYRPVDYQRTALDNIISQIVWEPPTEVVILRSSDLIKPLTSVSTSAYIPAADAQNWPYTGMFQCEGEVIEYDGKEYRYIDDTDGGVTKYAKVSSLAEYQKYYWKTNSNKQQQNGMTGRLYLKERGLWNTYPAAHSIAPYGYTVRSTKGGSSYATVYGYYYAKNQTPTSLRTYTGTGYRYESSYIRLQSSTTWTTDQYLYATRGSTAGDAPNFYGAKLKIKGAGQTHNYGGLSFNMAGTMKAGYHVEMRPTEFTTTGTKEVIVYVKAADGTTTRINGVGWRADIVKNVYYTLDIQFSRGDSALDGGYGNASHYIWVWLNGRLLGRAAVTGSLRMQNSDNFGMFLRGSSCMDYEYLYAYERKEVTTAQFWGEDVSFYDRVIGGYVANQSLDEFTEKTRRARRRTRTGSEYFTQRYDTKFFDEMGAVIHEMRHYDVKFDGKLPGQAPKLLATNEVTAKYLDFRATAFGAEFYAVNASHEDTNIHGTLNDVDERLGVVMEGLIQTDPDEVTIEDAESIRKIGRKEIEVTSDWIQTESQANTIGEWIKSHWDHNTDEITVTIFGNNLLELTDVVYVNDPQTDRLMVKYFVIAIENEFDQGLSSTVRLRKVKV